MWLDDVTSTRALINISHVPDPEVVTKETDDTKELGDPTQESKCECTVRRVCALHVLSSVCVSLFQCSVFLFYDQI